MHIPPYYKKTGWQRFFVGAFFGACIAYFIFLFMHGTMYENLLEDYYNLESEVSELKKINEALLEDQEDLTEKSKQSLTVDKIEIHITNGEQLRLDRLLVHQLEEMVKEEINHIIGQNIHTVAASEELLLSTIENKEFSINDFNYRFKIRRLTISQTVKITAETEISN